MRINHNISALITQGSVFRANRSMAKSIEKLSTGLRINTAADDAAGLGVSENLRTQVRGLQQALKNTQDTIAMLNIADGALNEQAEILQRMRELVIQAKNDTYTQTERNYMYQEFSGLMNELDRIAAVTNYNGMNLFAAPNYSGHASANIYDDDYENGIHEDDYETPHATYDGKSLWSDDGNSIFGENDLSSANYFNMMIGANYQEEDIQAYKTLSEEFQRISAYGDRGAANMITIALGQMDANALLTPFPGGAGGTMGDARNVWDSFGWNPGDPPFSADLEDSVLDLFGPDDVIADFGDFGLGQKMNMLLRIIDGKTDDVNDAMIDNVYGGVRNVTGLDRINRMRSYIGATINRLEHTISNSSNQIVNQQAAESAIRDVDFADETTTFTKTSILTQSATAMLAQANMNQRAILLLIQ